MALLAEPHAPRRGNISSQGPLGLGSTTLPQRGTPSHLYNPVPSPPLSNPLESRRPKNLQTAPVTRKRRTTGAPISIEVVNLEESRLSRSGLPGAAPAR